MQGRVSKGVSNKTAASLAEREAAERRAEARKELRVRFARGASGALQAACYSICSECVLYRCVFGRVTSLCTIFELSALA